jgi:hypothetical protein
VTVSNSAHVANPASGLKLERDYYAEGYTLGTERADGLASHYGRGSIAEAFKAGWDARDEEVRRLDRLRADWHAEAMRLTEELQLVYRQNDFNSAEKKVLRKALEGLMPAAVWFFEGPYGSSPDPEALTRARLALKDER